MERSLARAPSHPNRITSGLLLLLLRLFFLPPLAGVRTTGDDDDDDDREEEQEEEDETRRSSSSSSSSLSVTRTSLSFPRAGNETTARCLLFGRGRRF